MLQIYDCLKIKYVKYVYLIIRYNVWSIYERISHCHYVAIHQLY